MKRDGIFEDDDDDLVSIPKRVSEALKPALVASNESEQSEEFQSLKGFQRL